MNYLAIILIIVVVLYLARPYDEVEEKIAEHRSKLEEDTRLL